MRADLGRICSGTLLASGMAGLAMPDRVGRALHVALVSSRGRAEVRAGLGGTFAGMAAYAFVSRSRGAQLAVAATWLGAAASRMLATRLDDPEVDWTYWSYLALELTLGCAGVWAAHEVVHHSPRRAVG